MPKRDLRSQIAANGYRDTDAEDFMLAPAPSSTPFRRVEVVKLPLDQLVEYDDQKFRALTGQPQPFNEYSGGDLQSLQDSILQHGVLEPIVVRPLNDGKLQILSGRHRARASRAAGLTHIPGTVRPDIDDEQAALIMLDTNLQQRHNLTYKERAYAYRMKVELEKKQGRRNDLKTLCNGCTKSDILAETGQEFKESRRMVAYLIRLTYLIPELLQLVDDGKLLFMAGVQLSYLTAETQKFLYHTILPECGKITERTAKKIRQLEEEGLVSPETVRALFKRKEAPATLKLSLPQDAFSEYKEILQDNAKLQELFLQFLKQLKEAV